MTNRENMLMALRRDNPERVPFEVVLCPYHIAELKRRTGSDDYYTYFDLPFRQIELNKTNKVFDIHKYYGEIPQDTAPISWNPDWGILGTYSTTAHFQHMLHPMAGLNTIDDIHEYPFPDFNESYRWNGIPEKVRELKKNGLAAIAFMEMTTFEIAWYLRGMEKFIIDMVFNTEFAEVLLDEIVGIHSGMARKYAKADVDILMLGDDIATQLNMLINPDLWRSMIKPRLGSIIKAAKEEKNDILVLYHSDGNVQKVIPDLIEIGVDILNPVQPECMDPEKLKQLYGDRLSFWGTLGTQTTLPFGTPGEIRKTCRNLIENVGKGGGLLLAPTHMIEPDVPWENIMAFIDAVKEYKG
jgi:uroporphyrinogen decarboxylase